MKEHLLTLFLAITTSATLFIFTVINSQVAVPVFNQNHILFEHQTAHGNLVVSFDAFEDFRLSFLTRGINGKTYADSSFATTLGDLHILTLVSSETIPFTTHAIVSTNPELSEIIIVENGFKIAHRAHAKKTACNNTAVFMVSSIDLTGNDVLFMGFDINGELIAEIAIP